MSRPAHKASFGTKRRSRRASEPRAVHSARAMAQLQAQASDGSVVGLSSAVVDKLNEVAPASRRALRLERQYENRRRYAVASVSLAALVTSTTLSLSNANGKISHASGESTTSTTLTPVSGAASRSESRDDLHSDSVAGSIDQGEGEWSLGSANSSLDVSMMSRSSANNPHVAEFMDMDQQLLPAGFNPNHESGDVGNAYEFSQCTWWAYTRRLQLGLPVGSHFGNGADWGASARRLGYWVDNAPRHVGDIMVFAPGQSGTDATYGHVAIVEKINSDGSVVTSECGQVCQGKTYSKTYAAADAAAHQFIHY